MADIAVQRGTASFSGSSTTVTLTAGVDYTAPSSSSKAFCHITATRPTSLTSGTTNGAADNSCVTVDDSSITTQIVFTRTGTDTSRLPRIDWEIVEYTGANGGAHEFVVRGRGTVSFSSSEQTKDSSAVSGVVSDADMVPWITGSRANTTFDFSVPTFRSVWNSGSDTVTFDRSTAALVSATVSFVAIEFTGSAWSVAVYDQDLTAGSQTKTITSVGDVSRAFMHVQVWGRGSDVARNSTAEAFLSAADTITYVTDAGFAGTDLNMRTWVIANSQTGTGAMSVQRLNGTETARNGTFTRTPSAVVLADTSVMECSARSAHADANRMPRDVVSWRLTGTTTLTGYQINNVAGIATDYRVALVTWPTAQSISNSRLQRFYLPQIFRKKSSSREITLLNSPFLPPNSTPSGPSGGDSNKKWWFFFRRRR